MSGYANIFDTHAHYEDTAFDGDRERLLTSVLPDGGVCGVINCGSDLQTSEKSAGLAAGYPYIYTAAGIHPECLSDVPPDWESRLSSLLSRPKTVAIGEIGLDYHFKDGPPRGLQKEFFEKQIILAKNRGLPIIVHDRDAHGDTMEILRRLKPAGTIHCFSGSVEMAKEVLRLGMYIGIGGAVTFKNAKTPLEVAKMIPDDRLLFETDCPYMAPVPFRGKRNDSTLITYVAQKVAALRGVTAQHILDTARKNAETLYLSKS
ncbi:MAG TPA: hydrolase TatD [Ruminococcaceae bacterium]|nr:hydrolase TatD [Oscillospiraceae bacterium]